MRANHPGYITERLCNTRVCVVRVCNVDRARTVERTYTTLHVAATVYGERQKLGVDLSGWSGAKREKIERERERPG